MCKKCLEYRHNSRTCQKDNHFAIILKENETSVTEPVVPPTQAN